MTMYNEPDWSSLSVAELLEKAQEFAKKAYGNALSSYSFIDRALERMPRGTKGGAELAELMAKAQQVYQTCIGYLDHPFKNKPYKTGKELLPILQTEAGWCTIRCRHQHPHARTTILSGDGDAS
jgi:hypothetical protein